MSLFGVSFIGGSTCTPDFTGSPYNYPLHSFYTSFIAGMSRGMSTLQDRCCSYMIYPYVISLCSDVLPPIPPILPPILSRYAQYQLHEGLLFNPHPTVYSILMTPYTYMYCCALFEIQSPPTSSTYMYKSVRDLPHNIILLLQLHHVPHPLTVITSLVTLS